MKRLKAGAVNSISFIRNISYTTNSFGVEFEKVVGTTALTLSGIEDQLGLADCSDFIVLNIDLVSNELDGGEYYMTITNGGNSSTYLCEVQSYKYNTLGTSIYSDSVVLSTDLTSSAVENEEAVTDPSAPLSISEQFDAEQVKLFIADSLADAQTLEPTLSYGTNIFGPASGVTQDLSGLINGTKKLYAYSAQSGSYIYWAGTLVSSNPNGLVSIPFAANFPPPFYKTVELVANQIKEIDVFGTDAMFPILTGGLNGADLYIEASITKLDYVKDLTVNYTINSRYEAPPYAFARKPAWASNSDYDNSQWGSRVAIYAALINDDV